MGYFNMFDEWAMDPKVQCLDEKMQRRHAMLLCLRNIGATDCTPDSEVKKFMGISFREVLKTKELFKQKGFISGDGWHVTNWEKRQSGQSESLERVRKHRANKYARTNESNVTDTVTETLHGNTPRGRVLTNLRTNLLTKEPPNPLPGGKSSRSIFVPPEWVPLVDWHDYVEMRAKNRKAMTWRAKELLVARLARFREQGHNVGELLQRAIEGCWQTIYAPDDPKSKQNGFHRNHAPVKPEPTPTAALAAYDERQRLIAAASRIGKPKESP